jgi:hypothetical protein
VQHHPSVFQQFFNVHLVVQAAGLTPVHLDLPSLSCYEIASNGGSLQSSPSDDIAGGLSRWAKNQLFSYKSWHIIDIPVGVL